MARGCQPLLAGAGRQPVRPVPCPVPPLPPPLQPVPRYPAAAAPQCAWLWLSAAHDSAPLPEPEEGGKMGRALGGACPHPTAAMLRDGL